MRPNIDISHALNGRVKDYAAEHGLTTSEAYREIITTGLAELQEPSTDPQPQAEPQPDQSEPDRVDLDALLSDWRPGDPGEDRRQRRAAGAEVLRTLRNDGRMSASDFQEQLHPEHAIGDEKPGSWWTRTAKPAVDIAKDADLVRFIDGHKEYEWLGSE